MVRGPESPPYVHVSVPNRSLGPAGRRWVFAALAVTTLGIGVFAAAFGAWLVLPFAGLELAFVALAFHALDRHDGDFERLEIDANEVRVEARDAECVTCFVANRPWARAELRERGVRCTLCLAYAGRKVPLGRLLSDEGRRRLAGEIRGWIPVTEN